MYSNICMHAQERKRVGRHTHTHTHVRTPTPTHTHTHKHTHSHTLSTLCTRLLSSSSLIPAGWTGDWLNHARIRTAVASRTGGAAEAGIAGVRALSALYWCDGLVCAVVAPRARKASGCSGSRVVAITTCKDCQGKGPVMISDSDRHF